MPTAALKRWMESEGMERKGKRRKSGEKKVECELFERMGGGTANRTGWGGERKRQRVREGKRRAKQWRGIKKRHSKQ